MSTAFVFAWLEDFSFRHELLPILPRLALPGNFLEFKSRKMGVALVLTGKCLSGDGESSGSVEYIPLI